MKVSVVIPCYNAEPYLDRCLAGIFAQTHTDLEIIAVDDGSTDGTAAMLHEAAARSPFPFQVIEQANAGACAARNAGTSSAVGTYIQYMDADDVLAPEKIGHQAAVAQRNGMPGLVVGGSLKFDPDGTLHGRDLQEPGDRDQWLDLMRHRLGRTPTNLWERRAVVEAGGWDENLRSSQEYELMFRMFLKGVRPVFDGATLTHVHLQASGSISTTRLDRAWTRFVELRARIIEHIENTQPNTDLRPYHQALVDSIRTLYPHAPREAVSFYKKYLPKGFSPGTSRATGKGYLVLHRLLGFSLANRLRQLLSGHGANRP